MIRHIVLWKLKAQDTAGKAASAATIAGVLEPLALSLHGVRSLRVHANSAYLGANWDLVLVGDYDSLEALDAYQVHPDHVAAVATVRQHTADRAAVDFEVDEA